MLGILQLLTYRHALPGPDELGQVGVEGMMRESRKLDAPGPAVASFGQCYLQYLGRFHRILAEHLIEVPYTEEQYRVRVPFLHLGVLLHQRCLGDTFRLFNLILRVALDRLRRWRLRRRRFYPFGIIQLQIEPQFQRLTEGIAQVMGDAVNSTLMLVQDGRFPVWVGADFRLGAYNILRECRKIFVGRYFSVTVND